MQQRTQIARVLANDPRAMLMDEPFGALDALTREHMQTELLGSRCAVRPTVLLITHSVEEAIALGARVIVMSPRPGRIVLDEPQPFAERRGPQTDVRADAEFVAACHRVRAALPRQRHDAGERTHRSTPMRSSTVWKVNTLTSTIGAELVGGDLADVVDGTWLLELLHQHLVLVIREQHLAPAAQVALARRLGTPTPAHPVVPGHPDHPEILELDGARGGRNARWHTDVTFTVDPPAASLLVADQVPESGGDTLWADLRGAYEHLAAPVRELVDQLEAVHRISPLAYWGEPFDTALGREDAQQLLDRAAGVPPVIHPVVRVHPATGRASLFVNPGFTSHVIGLSRIESDALLRMLYDHSTQPEHVVRHRWRRGDVVLWDNHATMHYATDDYGAASRAMRRVTLQGTVPVGPTGARSHVALDPLVAIR
jgi:alpha-ketoglutarate-dependent taurine dioxygenase